MPTARHSLRGFGAFDCASVAGRAKLR
jgi:hypothetical protein